MDDIRTENTASESEREADMRPAGDATGAPHPRRVGPESEVRGGAEAPDPAKPDN